MIFLAGVSASGKTFAAASFAAANEFLHIRASSVLVEQGRPITSLSKLRAIENQKVLLEKIKDSFDAKWNVIIDGHATLETTDGAIQVPDWFFDNLKLDKIICMIDDPVIIAQRRNERGENVLISEIEGAQNYEILNARRQAERLSVPYREIVGRDEVALRKAILEK